MKDDGSWRALEGTWDRLRWSRLRWQEQKGGASTAEAAAETFGIKPATYRAYERSPGSSKHIGLDHQLAARFGRKFGVDWEWLLTGSGSPFTQRLTPAEQRALDAMREVAPEDQERVAAVIQAAFRTGTHG